MKTLIPDFPERLLVPPRTFCQMGALSLVPEECARFGLRGVLLYGRALEQRMATWTQLVEAHASRISFVPFRYRSAFEPTLQDVSDLIRLSRENQAEFICAVGGGSILDVGKAAAGLFHASMPPAYYQANHPLMEQGIPFIAVPTTAGTGSEATVNSVLLNEELGEKLSIRDDSFMARSVILDGDLLLGQSREAIAHSGLDAWVQGVESYLSRHATRYSQTLSLQGLFGVLEHLPPFYETNGAKHALPLLLASHRIGLAFAASRLGMIHGLAHPLGSIYKKPHGSVCASALLPALSMNQALAPERYHALCQGLTRDVRDISDELLAKLSYVSPFKGAEIVNPEAIIRATIQSGSTQASPFSVTQVEVEKLLMEIFKK